MDPNRACPTLIIHRVWTLHPLMIVKWANAAIIKSSLPFFNNWISLFQMSNKEGPVIAGICTGIQL